MKRRTKRAVAVAVGEVLMAGILLLTFSFFHHVLPRMRAPQTPVNTPTVSVTPTPAPTPVPVETEAVPEATEEPQEPKSEWQLKFAEHFSDEVVITENSYKSPEISVTVTEHTVGEGNRATVYFVMDIYVAQIENFRTCISDNPYQGQQTMSKSKILDMAAAHNAIAAVNGDFYSYQYGGVMVRNGEVYRRENYGYDICVLFKDGTMETYRHNEYNAQVLDALIERGIWQAWQFGPELMNDNGEADCSFNTSGPVQFANPRTAVGYFEPGHYCFLTADGRQDGYSYGLLLDEMAKIFEELGCKAAYNLDGGGSAVMCFNGDYVNRQSNGGDREISDLLLIAEVEKEG